MINIQNLTTQEKEVINAIPVPTLYFDLQGRCVFANTAWTELSGKSLQETLDNGWQTTVTDQDAPQLAQALDDLVKKQRSSSTELRFNDLAGKPKWTRADFRIIKSEGESPLGFIGSFVDITETKEKVTNLEKKLKDLETLNGLLIDRELTMIQLKKEIAKLRGGHVS